eukprot:183320_1
MNEWIVQVRNLAKTNVSRMSFLTKCVGSIVTFLVARKIYCKLRRIYYSYPPGSDGLPLVGSLFSFMDIPKYASFLKNKYGPISMINIGIQPIVFLHSIDYINEVFKNQNALDRDWNQSLILRHIKNYEFSTAIIEEKYWRRK